MTTTVPVTYHLTSTPLARAHERPRARRSPSLPWTELRRELYDASTLAWAARAYRALATGEYLSVGLFARIADALAAVAAPFDLVAEGARIPSDEIRHAEHALRMASACAGAPVTLDVDLARVWDPRARPTTLDELDVVMLDVAAIGESVAVAVLGEAASVAEEPLARALLRGLVADEVHHARIGWYYAAWRAPQWSRAERQRVADRVAEVALDVDRRFARQAALPRAVARQAAALGVLDGEHQRTVAARAMKEQIVPGLDALGLGTSAVTSRGAA